MKYEKFEEWMIGKKVLWNGDKGAVTREYEGEENCVWVEWESPGIGEAWIEVESLEFLNASSQQDAVDQPVPSEHTLIPWEGRQIDWQVGQVVWDVVYGKGVVDEVSGGYVRPIEVQFIDGVRTYTVDGKPDKELARTLFFSEPVITAELYPPKKPFTPTFKKGDTVVVKKGDTTQVLIVSEETERQLKGSRGEVWDKDPDVHFYKIGEEVKFS